MAKYYYKHKSKDPKAFIRFIGLLMFVVGSMGVLYTLFPLLSWQIYFTPAFAATDIATPIPKTTIVTSDAIKTLLVNSSAIFQGVNYSNAQNWFPTAQLKEGSKATVSFYKLSVPILGITDALVSTQDYDLDRHLVNYPGTAVPGQNGTAVIFGHSTLPQLFDPKNYKAIFATAYKLQVGDEIDAKLDNATYIYKIYSLTVVDPTDTSIFAQNYDNSYITIVTCTPPGTTWKRLIIKARLQKI